MLRLELVGWMLFCTSAYYQFSIGHFLFIGIAEIKNEYGRYNHEPSWHGFRNAILAFETLGIKIVDTVSRMSVPPSRCVLSLQMRNGRVIPERDVSDTRVSFLKRTV